jgi:methionyl-tRNA formyltransferase
MTSDLQSPLRITFAGTPDFAVPALLMLAASGHRIVAVYCQPDRPAGRGRKPRACPVKRKALELGIPVSQPRTLRNAETQAELRALDLDLMVVAAYGLILPAGVLSTPRQGCINVHASLLPRWRGAAPIQRAILAGDETSGISIMQMDEGLDTGPVLAVSEVPIHPAMTGGELHDTLATEGARLLASVLETVTQGTLEATAQPVDGATYADKIDKSEARIDWTRPATLIERQVRAFNPWPVAFTAHRGEALRIWDARALDAPAAQPPGQVIAESRAGIDVCCGEGRLRITRLQLPGKRPVTSEAFLNAHRLAGSKLG